MSNRTNQLIGRHTSRASASGLTLVEILVTLVITSVGLLGVAALQLTMLRSNYDATVRTRASVLTEDIIDRMRANRSAAVAGNYNIAINAAAPASPATRADNDLVEWKTALAASLVGSPGTELEFAL